MTFRNLSNIYGSSHQQLHVDDVSTSLCSTLHNSQQLQQHQLSTGAGEHLCTRFCCFEPLFGNVFRCQTSGITHVCDQGCSERIFLDNHFDICRCVSQHTIWVLRLKFCYRHSLRKFRNCLWALHLMHCNASSLNSTIPYFAGSARNCFLLRSTQTQPAERGALMTITQGASTRGLT